MRIGDECGGGVGIVKEKRKKYFDAYNIYVPNLISNFPT